MIRCFFDGACEPVNPGGVASFGAVIFKDGKKIWESSDIMFPEDEGRRITTSNNVAEYKGLQAILVRLHFLGAFNEEIIIMGDSKLVIKQMRGEWRIRQGIYVPFAKECRNLLQRFKRVKFQWIPREENGLADNLSKALLEKYGVQFKLQPGIVRIGGE